MPVAPPGEVVYLYIDAARVLEKGDYVRTNTGRTYEVVSNRIQARGMRKGRQHLQALVLGKDADLDPDSYVLDLHWYSRNKRL